MRIKRGLYKKEKERKKKGKKKKKFLKKASILKDSILECPAGVSPTTKVGNASLREYPPSKD